MNISSELAIAKSSQKKNWITKLVAILALVNFAIVLFDCSYVPWRDFYLQASPPWTQFYDRFKGIEPHPITEDYLEKFEILKEKVLADRLDSPQVKEDLLELRTISDRLLDNNPFEAIGKSSTLEKIKHELGDRVGQNDPRATFATFWNQAYLDRAGWQQEIRPLA